jgi:hypothetical protein
MRFKLKKVSSGLLVLASGQAMASGLSPMVGQLLLQQSAPPKASDIQPLLNAAIASGSALYTLPNTTILCDKSIEIPAGTRNFTLAGGSNTKLVRASSSMSSPLIQIGDSGNFGLSNEPFSTYSQFKLQPISEFSSTVTLSSPATIDPGYYVIIGKSLTEDRVLQVTTGTEFWVSRELVQIDSQSSNTLTLREPIGREFVDPYLVRIETNSTPVASRKVMRNIRLSNIWVDGRLGDRTTGRAQARSKLVGKAITIGLGDTVVLNNIRVSGFQISGVSAAASKRITIQNSSFFDSNTKVNGYGIELSGSRFGTISDCSFQDLRWGTIFAGGTMDVTVTNCSAPPGRGGFDVGHGQGERRITMQNCIGEIFSIGNPAWLKGNKGIQFIDCSAYGTFDVYGHTENLTISGMHSSQSKTARVLQLLTEGGGLGLPFGPTFPISVLVKDARFFNPLSPGNCVQMGSVTTSATPSANLYPRLGLITFRNTVMENPLANGNGLMGLRIAETGGITGNASMVFDQGTVLRTVNPGVAPITFPANGPSGNWNVDFNGINFDTPFQRVAAFSSGANGTFRFTSSTRNGSAINSGMISNSNGANSVVLITP